MKYKICDNSIKSKPDLEYSNEDIFNWIIVPVYYSYDGPVYYSNDRVDWFDTSKLGAECRIEE